MKQLVLIAMLALLAAHPAAHAQNPQSRPWQIDQTLSDANTQVNFEVDSTWHLVHGTTKHISGKVWLENPADPTTIRASIALPVSNFDTDSSSRDTRMREVMRADTHPEVQFTASGVERLCVSDLSLPLTDPCTGVLHGSLTINGVSLPQNINVQLRVKDETMVVEGKHTIRWADFGVEDPSILIAKLDPEVVVSFTVSFQHI